MGGFGTIGGDGGIHSCNEDMGDMSKGGDGDSGFHSCDGGDNGEDLLWGADKASDWSLDCCCLSLSMDIASASVTLLDG